MKGWLTRNHVLAAHCRAPGRRRGGFDGIRTHGSKRLVIRELTCGKGLASGFDLSSHFAHFLAPVYLIKGGKCVPSEMVANIHLRCNIKMGHLIGNCPIAILGAGSRIGYAGQA